MSTAFKLGDRVRYRKPLKRRLREEHPNTYGTGWLKVWEPLPHYSNSVPEPEYEGIVVGLRTLADGKNRYNGYEEPITFTATSHFPAVMIARDLRRNPDLVRIEDVELVQESHDSQSGATS